jgi:tripartite-type tricarboxylate transporter receptor subunit TctC
MIGTYTIVARCRGCPKIVCVPIFVAGLLCAAAPAYAAGPGAGSAYPAKPVRIVVPNTAGGATDIIARAFAQKLTERWGQPVVVENRPGGNSLNAATLVARSTPDGYTLFFTTSFTVAISPYVYRKLPYDPLRDFAPVALCCVFAQMITVNAALGVNTLKDLIALARAKPGALAYGSMGNASSGHLNMEAFKQLAGVDLVHVPYKGAAPAVIDLAAGQIAVMVVVPAVTQAHVQSGRLKWLAVGSPERSSAFPDVPTAAEAGLPGYEASDWLGLFAPAATPREIVSKLNAEIGGITASPEFREQWLKKNGMEPKAGTPAEFAAFLRANRQKWERLAKSTGARLD